MVARYLWHNIDNVKKLMKILFIVILFFSVLSGVYFLEKENLGNPAFSSVDLEITQYSDRHITDNAKTKDERFRQVAFAEPNYSGRNLFNEQLALVWDIFRSIFFPKSTEINNELVSANQKEYGTWVWTPTMSLTPEYMRSTLDDLKKEGVNVVYLSIDSYLDIYVLPEGPEKIEKQNIFSGILEEFIILAKERGIAVDAEAGWQNWAEEGHTYKAFAIASFVKNFNEKHVNKFRGFQYDVEPYMLESYRASEKGKEKALTEFTKLTDQTVEYLVDSELRFSIVIPDFYDKRDGKTPGFFYNNKKDFAFQHLLRVLEKKPGSSIIVMSYRNFARGMDGSIDVSKNEMKTASSARSNSKIILAQETGDVPPSYITFHNTSKDYFREETNKLSSAFSDNPHFAGLAIHYANAFISLTASK